MKHLPSTIEKMGIVNLAILLGAATFSGRTLASPVETPHDSVEESCADPTIVGGSTRSHLAMARDLKAPIAADTAGAEFEHASFWEDNGPLLRNAWEEWEGMHLRQELLQTNGQYVNRDDDDEFIHPTLSTALEGAFSRPSEVTEASVKSLWKHPKVSDDQRLPRGVYATQLLAPTGVSRIRSLLDSATSSGIPTRRPNGMNRNGVILDRKVDGAVSVNALSDLVEGELIERVVRPVGRMLFPDRIGCGDDSEYFAFTIRYADSDDDDDDASISKRDVKLNEHRDASIITLNINLNLPEEGYAGSEVYFREFPSPDATDAPSGDNDELVDASANDGGTVRFSPGMAIIHLGAHRHGAVPIGGGERYNLVIWLFGNDGDVRIAPYEKKDQMSQVERWRGCNRTLTHGLPFSN